jgi:lipopolysaccharide export system permease protein
MVTGFNFFAVRGESIIAMTILDRYVTKEFMRLLILILMTLILLSLLVDFFGKIRMFLSNQATFSQMASYFLWEIPLFASLTIPASVLLASLMTFASLSRTNEIIAMKANGISLYRTALPIIILSVFICVLTFFVSEFLTPYGIEKSEYIRLVDVQKQTDKGTFKQNQIWYRGRSAIYNFKLFNPDKNILKGITIFHLDPSFHLLSRTDAEWAEWQDGAWISYNLLVTTFKTGTFPVLEWIKKKPLDIPEQPSDFKVIQKDSEKMNYLELRHFINKMQEEGYDTAQYRVDMYGRTAFPFITLILVFIGISFSLRLGRSGGITRSIGLGIVIGFSYWLVHAFSLSLGHSGTLPPILSAWLANILFIAAAAYMFSHLET